MTNPQCENGYTKIANELLEAMVNFKFSGQELRAVLFVIRKTYGFNKKEDFISLSQFMKQLKVTKPRASLIVNNLTKMDVLRVIVNDNGLTKKYLFNKYYKQWRGLSKKVTVIVNDNKGYRKRERGVIVNDNHKRNSLKDNTTKEIKNIKKEIFTLPVWINEEAWSGYTEMRKKIKKPLTDHATTLVIKKLKAFKDQGHDPNVVLDNSTEASWQGIFEPRDDNGNKPLKKYQGIRDAVNEAEAKHENGRH